MPDNLYGLHLFDNAEKHTVIAPLVGVAKISHVKAVRGATGRGPPVLAALGGGAAPGTVIRLSGISRLNSNPEADLRLGTSMRELTDSGSLR